MEKKSLQNYSKYTSMAFQLLGAILFGTFVGQWIDKKMGTATPYFSAIGALLGVSVGLYVTLKDLLNQNPKSNKKDNGVS